MIKSITSDRLLRQASVRHAFYMRHGGVSEDSYASLNCSLTSDDAIAKVTENRKRVAEDFGVAPDKLVSCKQIHSADVVVVEEPWTIATSPEADAMVTKAHGIALAIATADCVPLLLSDYKSGVIGAAHAGWRGSLLGVVKQTVEAMVELGAAKENIVAAIGPSICQDSYEIDLQTMVQFTEQDVNSRRFFIESDKDSHYMFDLPGLVRAQARALGIADCVLSPVDTYLSEEDFFSCRRNAHKGAGPHGGQLSVIMLEE